MPVNRVSRKQLKLLRLWMKQDGRAAFSPTELRPHSPNQQDAKSPVFMRLCTNCISCMELPPLPKRARFLSDPPQNRLQISAQVTPLPTMIRADGQAENKGKTSRKHLNSFSFTPKGRTASFTRLGFNKRYSSSRLLLICDQLHAKGRIGRPT